MPYEELSKLSDGTSTATMREQVDRARAIQAKRFVGDPIPLNGRMAPRQIRKHCALDDEARSMLGTAMADLGLSARAHDRILRVARTIADLADSPNITPNHLAEAIGYRTLDRKLWEK